MRLVTPDVATKMLQQYAQAAVPPSAAATTIATRLGGGLWLELYLRSLSVADLEALAHDRLTLTDAVITAMQHQTESLQYERKQALESLRVLRGAV